MKEALYMGSHGLGEMVCQTPVMRRLAQEFDLTLVAPENLRPVFEKLPYITRFVAHHEAGFVATSGESFRMPWQPPSARNWFSGHFSKWERGPGWPHVCYPTKGGTFAYAEAYMRFVFGEGELPDEAYRMDAAPVKPIPACKVIVCVGSGEPNRRLDSSSHARLIHAASIQWDWALLPVAIPERSMEQMLGMIADCELLITPDTGPLHVALAMGKKVIALESRESMSQVVHPFYKDKVAVWRKSCPDCDRDCRARAGVNGGPDYPLCLRCWGQPVPCLALTDADIADIMVMAETLLARPADTAPSS